MKKSQIYRKERKHWLEQKVDANRNAEERGNVFIPRNGYLHKALVEYIDGAFDSDVGGTLTFQPYTQDWSSDRQLIMAQKAVRKYFDLIDQRIYRRNTVRRHGKRLARVVCIQHVGRNIHIHFEIAMPQRIEGDERLEAYRDFVELLRDKWLCHIEHAGDDNKFDPIWDQKGWKTYITRELRRHDGQDTIELGATHIPQTGNNHDR